jgi:tetratricopeptide (TPR) repeat protein
MSGFMYIGHTFLKMGYRQRAEDVFNELKALSKRTNNFALEITSYAHDAVMAFIDGNLEEVVNMARNIRTRGREAGASIMTDALASFADLLARIYLGFSLERLETAYRALPVAVGNEQPYQTNRIFCILLAHLGKREEVSEYLERFIVKRAVTGSIKDEMPDYALAQYLEAAVIIGHRKSSELLLNCLSGTSIVTTGNQQTICVPRTLGGAAALLGRYDEARQHYQEAIRVCTEMRFRPEMALTRLQIAELLLEHYPQEKKEALEHLDFAIKEFREMKMQPSLERALRHKDILKA